MSGGSEGRAAREERGWEGERENERERERKFENNRGPEGNRTRGGRSMHLGGGVAFGLGRGGPPVSIHFARFNLERGRPAKLLRSSPATNENFND